MNPGVRSDVAIMTHTCPWGSAGRRESWLKIKVSMWPPWLYWLHKTDAGNVCVSFYFTIILKTVFQLYKPVKYCDSVMYQSHNFEHHNEAMLSRPMASI